MKKIMLLLLWVSMISVLVAQAVATPTAIAFEAPTSPFIGDIISLENGIAAGNFTTSGGEQNIVEIATMEQIGANANLFQPIMKVLQLSDGSYYTMAIHVASGDTCLIKTVSKTANWLPITLPVGVNITEINDIFYFLDKPGYVRMRFDVSTGKESDLVIYNSSWDVIKTYYMFIEHVRFAINISDTEIITAQELDGSHIYKSTYVSETNTLSEEAINVNVLFNIDIEALRFSRFDSENNRLIVGIRTQDLSTWVFHNKVYALDLDFSNPQLDLLFEASHLDKMNFQLAISDEIVNGDMVIYQNGTNHWIKYPGSNTVTFMETGFSIIDLADNEVTSIDLGGDLSGYCRDLLVVDGKILGASQENPGPGESAYGMGIVYGPGSFDIVDGLLIIDFNPIIQPPMMHTYYADMDGDGFSSPDTIHSWDSVVPVGYLANMTTEDCNDSDSSINPAMEEILDNDIDENCDGIFGQTPNPNPNVGIGEIPKENLKIYNSNGAIHIETTDFDQYTFTLVNLLGQELASGDFEKEIELSIGKTNSILFLRIENQNGKSLVHKFYH